MSTYRLHPIDETSRARLAEQGLTLSLVDGLDDSESGVARYDAWTQADGRGFYLDRAADDALAFHRAGVGDRRTTGVWDDATPATLEPVATINSWPTELSVPGGRTTTGWAISSVTVAPTHTRRGIARSLLEAELRTASALGAPVAILTVSESTLYGRYGFGPAVLATDWVIESRRARPLRRRTEAGRVEFISLKDFRSEVAALHERVRAERPGEIAVWASRWDQIAGLAPAQEAEAKKLRAVRYLDADGVVQGVVIYTVSGGEQAFTEHRVDVKYLLDATPAASAALWGFVVELDLVREVTARLRSVDEPLRWMLADFRAAKVSTIEHEYVRVLDVVAAFEARGYSAAGSLAFEVTDPHGFADGTWLVEADAAGTATVRAVDEAPAGVPLLSLGVPELSSLYLGGVSAATLAAAGRVHERTPGDAVAADALLRSPVPPHLSVWY